MKKLLFILIAVSLFHRYTFGQWIQQTNPAAVTNLYGIQFINENTGWSCGVNSTILKTTNGGNNWFVQSSNLADNKNLHGPSILDSNNGFIVGWFGSILKTTNGGNNWIVLSDNPIGQGNSWNSCSFINAQTGWLCGFLGVVFRTTNGGNTWDSLNAGGTLRTIQFLNSQTGWVAGDGGYIRKTTNGGNTWQLQFQGTNSDYLNNSMHFININTGWLIGYRSFVFKTTNSGISWDTLISLSCESIRFASSLTGWCGGSLTGSNAAVMYKTIDGGFNWHQQNLPIANGYCGSIFAYNDSIAWSTYARFIIKTTNGGGNFIGIQPLTTTYPDKFLLKQNYPNPFNPSTKIQYQINNNIHVRLIVTDITGKQIASLVDEDQLIGTYEVNFENPTIASGIYFYRLITPDFSETKKMILIK